MEASIAEAKNGSSLATITSIHESRSAAKGLFTSTDPEKRRIVPEDVDGRVKVKLVYVVLEAQYQSSLSAAVQKINKSNDKVCFEVVGYLLEELRDSDNYATFKKDIMNANVFIGSLIFIEELADKVGGTLFLGRAS